jgi:hypothetical protein
MIMGMNASRIRKLEESLGIRGRVIVVGHPHEMTDAELEAFLEANGISTETDDLVVSLRRFGDGDPNPWVRIATPAN